MRCCPCCLLLCVRALRWLPQASLIKHAFEALCINEFKGLTFEADENGGGMKTGAHLVPCVVERGVRGRGVGCVSILVGMCMATVAWSRWCPHGS